MRCVLRAKKAFEVGYGYPCTVGRKKGMAERGMKKR